MRKDMRALIAVAALGLFGLGLYSPAAAAGTNDNKLRVVQHNTDMGGYQSALASASAWGDVDAVTFQELCESQKNELEQAGWQVHWVSQREGNAPCAPTIDGGTRKGPAIATKRGMDKSATFSKWLKSYNDRAFFLICAHITGSGIAKSWVCTTHLYIDGSEGGTGGAIRSEQTATIAGVLDGWVSDGRRVVLTGDFNAQPGASELDIIYRVQSGGTDTDKFWEGDQADQKFCSGLCRNMAVTTDNDRKLDYFFASHRGVDPHTGLNKTVVSSGTSGHHIVRGEVTFTPLG